MKIFCCGCSCEIDARLTSGREIYPYRKDLRNIPFWICDTCGNYVGCHHKTKDRTRPLGCIPTREIREARSKIHTFLDPIWKSGKVKRKELYRLLTNKIGREFHTAEIRSVEEAEKVIQVLKTLSNQQEKI